MYLETYSMEELMELIEEKGYCSVEAVEILKEMEQAKKGYDFLLRDCEEKSWKTDQVVVDYYRHLLEELRKALPYDAMGGQHTIPILVLQEFRKPDIVEKIRDFIGCPAGFSDHALLQEIQKFMTVHLDPQGIILYMDVLGNQPAARNVYKRGRTNVVKERVLAVPDTSIFIAELPEATRNIIRKDLEEHAREHHYRLEWDRESKDYVAMSRRFCDMENIYTDTYLHFCETGEDIDPYEKSLKRIVSIRLYQDEVEELCRKSGKVGLSIGELFENFVADLICGTHTNGSDERMYIEQWFDRCYFSIMPEETFLSYLLEMREIDRVLECWEILQELKELEEPDCYDKEELEIQQNTLEEYFQEYRTYTREPVEDQLEAAMEKVLEWNKEREHLLEGNVPEKSLGR